MASKQDDVDSLVKKLSALNVDPEGDGVDWQPKEDYYVHIDILNGCGATSKVARAINKHMVLGDAYDPRRVFNFPTNLLEEKNRHKLACRRRVAGIGDQYYELWKVRKTFSLAKFRKMVTDLAQETGLPLEVRIVRIIDNDHDINYYPLSQSGNVGKRHKFESIKKKVA